MGSTGARMASRVRLEPSLRLLPVSLVLGYLVGVAYDPLPTAYPLAIAIYPHEAVIILAPLGAAAGAWKAGRWRRSGWRSRPWRRGVGVPAAWEISITAGVQVAAYELIVVWVTTAAGRSLPFEPQVLAIAAATIAGWVAVGYAVGWWVRAELALPAVLIGSYLALVYPPAMEPLWLRHLTGTLGQCCAPSSALDRGAVRAMVLVPVAACIAALLAVCASRRPASAVAAVAVVLLAAVVAVPMVDHLAAEPIAARHGTVRCTGTPEVCVWPEQSDDLDRIAAIAGSAAARWAGLGLHAPARLSPRSSDLATARAASLQVWEHPTRYEVIQAMASGAVPQRSCRDGVGDIYVSQLVAVAWLTIEGGVEPSLVEARTDPALIADIDRLRAADHDAQVRWLEAVERADPCAAHLIPVPS